MQFWPTGEAASRGYKARDPSKYQRSTRKVVGSDGSVRKVSNTGSHFNACHCSFGLGVTLVALGYTLLPWLLREGAQLALERV